MRGGVQRHAVSIGVGSTGRWGLTAAPWSAVLLTERSAVGSQARATAVERTYGARMKHVTTADKSLLVGDEAADLLLDYAALVAQLGRGDSVRMRAIGVDGEVVTVGFLLNSGTTMLIESSTSTLPEPDNAVVNGYLRARLAEYDSAVQFGEGTGPSSHLGLV